ncbi:molybdate ABC transporter substrate-binding protein [Corynebacterium lubricantis]|uniref:molybdate ABC transporter substrate-binding protein n=1 Tax=Corynebacterium lubricantis TaxID=541095 RepID=UPI0003788E58|nr:molybdate ABC transporter substrate-binding protein [Corynebacterium lubricantis]
MLRRFTSVLAIAASCALVLAGCSSEESTGASSTSDESATLTVLGAASTRVLNDDLVQKSGMDLEFVNAGSSTLVQQLADGAPADILITADQENMDKALDNESVTDPEVVATNSMVMVVPAGNPAGIESVEDLQGDVNLVLCDPQVPCGTVSERLIEANNLVVNPVSLEHSVSDTLGKVTSGEADAGWVYRTDAAAAGAEVEVIEIPQAEDFPNSLVVAVTTNSENPEQAQELFDVIMGDEMAGVWANYGFTPVA